MLTLNKSKKKDVLTFTHNGRKSDATITVRVNENQRSFIEKNLDKIHFDTNNLSFFMMNYTPPSKGKAKAKPIRKISLNRAMWMEQNKGNPPSRIEGLPIIA
jgi:hypothetical protein